LEKIKNIARYQNLHIFVKASCFRSQKQQNAVRIFSERYFYQFFSLIFSNNVRKNYFCKKKMTAEVIFQEKEYIFATLRKAAAAILEVYNHSETIEKTAKNDGSPLTIADRKSHEIIVKSLREKWSEIPVLSEEGAEVDFQTRKNWSVYWCLDPLDGTKEFIKRNGEFAICLALIVGSEAVAGFILPPVTGEIFYGVLNVGAYKVTAENHEIPIKTSQKTQNLIAVGSRTHGSSEDEAFLANFSIAGFKACGSALKFCAIAEGIADLYYRSGPTMEWDTAAGQAILEAAGGSVKFLNGQRFSYNKESLRNPSFLCLAHF
jgi:3'(2'), 5'-bisphosphate nucleotidase